MNGPGKIHRGRSLRDALRNRSRAFATAEDGVMMVFGLIIFMIILMIGGMAVDLMRYESQRVKLQSVGDRAALAAASLSQPFIPEDVASDYFEKEGLGDYMIRPVLVNEGLNFRNVTVNSERIVPSLFMRLVGVKQLTAAAVSSAEERYTDVEVALVLDLSNSMNSFSRIQNLRDAGQEFVRVLFNNSGEDKVSLSVIPYTGQVNPGAALGGQFNVSFEQPFSHCMEFEAGAYGSLSLSTSTQVKGTGHFDPWHTSRAPVMFFCPTHPNGTGEIVPLVSEPGNTGTRIGNMIADGNTSIDIGVKWAAALLDPAARPVLNALIPAGIVPAAMQPRPLGYEVEDKLKVVVIMTDGENWEEWRMRDAFKTGQSEIWHTVPRTNALRNEIIAMHNGSVTPSAFQMVRPDNVAMPRTVGSLLSVRRPWDGQFYHPNPSQTNPTNGVWMSNNYPVNVTGSCTFYNSSGRPNLHYDAYVCSNWIAYRVSNPWLWHNFSVRWVARRIYNLSGIRSYSNFVNDVLYRVTSATKDQRLFAICDLLKTRDTPIFTVAFEAPPNGVAAMQTCATSPNHFFDVEGTRIRDAFRTIAGNIQNLRLVQ